MHVTAGYPPSFYNLLTTCPHCPAHNAGKLLPSSCAQEDRLVYSTQYFWVVLCKNRRYHKRQNLFFGHQIPLAETDAVLPPPVISEPLKVRCDDCGEEHSYEPKDLLRAEIETPAYFTPHPLFAD